MEAWTHAPVGVREEQVLRVVEVGVTGDLEGAVDAAVTDVTRHPDVADEVVRLQAHRIDDDGATDEPAARTPVMTSRHPLFVHKKTGSGRIAA